MLRYAKKILVLSFCLMAPLWAQEVIKVGMELTYPPFEMINTDGKPAGISVEIAEAFGKYYGKKIEIENIAFIGLIPSLKCKKIDMIISSMTVTKDRKKAIDFSDPYLQIGLCLLIAKNSTVSTIDDVDQKGKIVVVKQGTTGQVYAEKKLKKATILALDKESSCITEVVQGKADVFIYDQLSILKNWQKNSETTRALLTPFAWESWAVGLRKGEEDLKESINSFIFQFRNDGELQKLEDKYLKEQKLALEQLGISLYL